MLVLGAASTKTRSSRCRFTQWQGPGRRQEAWSTFPSFVPACPWLTECLPTMAFWRSISPPPQPRPHDRLNLLFSEIRPFELVAKRKQHCRLPPAQKRTQFIYIGTTAAHTAQ